LENTSQGRGYISRCHLGGKNMKRGREKGENEKKEERGKKKEEREIK
jgi:hypothetical protein